VAGGRSAAGASSAADRAGYCVDGPSMFLPDESGNHVGGREGRPKDQDSPVTGNSLEARRLPGCGDQGRMLLDGSTKRWRWRRRAIAGRHDHSLRVDRRSRFESDTDPILALGEADGTVSSVEDAVPSLAGHQVGPQHPADMCGEIASSREVPSFRCLGIGVRCRAAAIHEAVVKLVAAFG
jgi:hypothetical protein